MQRTQNMKHINLRAFAREHEESATNGTAAENKIQAYYRKLQ